MLRQQRPLQVTKDSEKFELDFSRVRGSYTLPPFSEDLYRREYEETLKSLAYDYVLFPNGLLSYEGFRRSDGVWITFEDDMTREIAYRICVTVEHGGYPPSLGSFFEQVAGVDKRRLVFALSQLIGSSCFGHSTPSEFGYDPTDTVDSLDGVELTSCNLYCGSLALWESNENDVYPHTLISLAHYLLRDESTGGVMPVITYLEKLCFQRGARGYPNGRRGLLSFEVAKAIALGDLVLLDVPSTPFTRIKYEGGGMR